jgi:hypothetical protein
MSNHQSSFMKGFSEPYLADLGRVVAAWSHVEFQFDMLFLSLVVFKGAASGSMSNPDVVKMGQGFKTRLKLFRQRIEELDIPPDTYRAVDKALNELGRLRSNRDEFAHSQLSLRIENNQISQDAAQSIFKSWKNQKPHEFGVITQQRLKETFQKMEALYWELHELLLSEPLRAQRPRQP